MVNNKNPLCEVVVHTKAFCKKFAFEFIYIFFKAENGKSVYCVVASLYSYAPTLQIQAQLLTLHKHIDRNG